MLWAEHSGQDNYNNKVLYGDFNVLRLLYLKHLSPENFVIYPDGLLVSKIIKLKYNIKVKNEASTDLQYRLIEYADENELSVGFVGDTTNVHNKLREKIIQKYPGIRTVCFIDGYQTFENINKHVEQTAGDILFVGLGAGRQEEWLLKHGGNLNFKLVIACGGWFRYLAEIKQRAPGWMLRIRAEWLHKILTEFRRVWMRYLIFSFHFIYLVLMGKIRLKYLENTYSK